MVGAVDVDDEVADQSLVGAEVAVLRPPHHDLADGIEGHAGRRLEEARRVGNERAEGGVELRDRHRGHLREGRVGRRGEVGMELEEIEEVVRRIGAGGAVQLVVAVADEEGGRARRRRRRAVDVARRERLEGEAVERRRREAEHAGGEAGQHARAIEGVDGRRALVRRHVVAVRPHRVLGVVRERRGGEVVADPAAGQRIARPGHVDAEMLADRSQLRHEPAARERVEEDDAVVVARGARAARGAQVAEPGRAGEQSPVALPVDGEGAAARRVDHLDVVVRADVADRVGRRDAGEALAVEVEVRGREQGGRGRRRRAREEPTARGRLRGRGGCGARVRPAADGPLPDRVARAPRRDGGQRPHVPGECRGRGRRQRHHAAVLGSGEWADEGDDDERGRQPQPPSRGPAVAGAAGRHPG